MSEIKGKIRSPRNKTMTLTPNEKKLYGKRAITLYKPETVDEIINKTILGDTFDVLPLLPDNFVDLLVVDPPYNLDKDFDGSSFKRMNDVAYADYTRSWIEKCVHTLKANATIYVCCDWRSSMVIGPILSEYFNIQNRITWQREKGRGAKTNWKNGMEDIWFATKSTNYTFNIDSVKIRKRVLAPYTVDGMPKDWEKTDNGNFRNTHPSNFWDDITIPYWSMVENTEHPTQKPEKLIAKLILASSNQGDTVLDPFLGSGSVSVAAKKLKRNFVGIEQNSTFCALAEKRLSQAEINTSIQGYTNGVFWERNSGNK